MLDAVKAGATGYLLKSAGLPEFLDAVARTAAGDTVFTPGLAGLVLGEFRRLAVEPTGPDAAAPKLTERETEVLRLVAKGLSYRQIAERLVLSHRTVQNHVQNTLGKLQLHNRVELTRYAIEQGPLGEDLAPPYRRLVPAGGLVSCMASSSALAPPPAAPASYATLSGLVVEAVALVGRDQPAHRCGVVVVELAVVVERDCDFGSDVGLAPHTSASKARCSRDRPPSRRTGRGAPGSGLRRRSRAPPGAAAGRATRLRAVSSAVSPKRLDPPGPAPASAAGSGPSAHRGLSTASYAVESSSAVSGRPDASGSDTSSG